MQKVNACTAIAAFLLKACMEEWPEPSFDFIAHMLSQIKDHNQKADAPHTDAQKHTFLEDSVQNIPQLASIKSTAELLDNHTSGGTKTTFEKCVTTLKKAAQECDLKVCRVASKLCRPSCTT